MNNYEKIIYETLKMNTRKSHAIEQGVLLQTDFEKTAKEIAEKLGISSNVIPNVSSRFCSDCTENVMSKAASVCQYCRTPLK